MSDPTAATGLPSSPAKRPRYKRKLSNFLLDKKLQLRYILVVTILSGLIAGALGFMIYDQRRAASESIENDLQVLTSQDGTQDKFQEQIAADLESEDRALVYKMIAIGIALVVILSLYLVIMTHKVAGPLFKVSMYFDRMADGRLGVVTPLRRGDMLQDFFQTFKDMHEAVRARVIADTDLLDKAVASLRDSKNQADYRGEAWAKVADAVDALGKHLEERRPRLADFPPRPAAAD